MDELAFPGEMIGAEVDAASAGPAVTHAKVLLVHGIWNARSWLLPLAWRLRALGLAADSFGYATILGGPEAAVPRLARRIRDSGATALVGHSLGGLVALQALRQMPELPVTHVVCLGSPLLGSTVARGLADRGAAFALGRSAGLLQQGLGHWDGAAAVGLVAGRVARGLGRVFPGFEGESDGTVTVAETRLPGLADHCLVDASHSGLVLSPRVAEQVANFLRDGRFRHD